MNNPMAQTEPVEQRFGVPASNETAQSPEATRQIDGTDVIEQGTLAAENVLEALKDVIDPELGINIVDLGLVYGVVIGAENQVRLDMTLTSAACPLTDVIERQAQTILSGVTDEVQINWVWMPPWGPDRITPDGREQLRAIGFNDAFARRVPGTARFRGHSYVIPRSLVPHLPFSSASGSSVACPVPHDGPVT